MEEVAWDDPLPQVLGQEDGSQGQGSSSLGSSSQPLATLLIRLHTEVALNNCPTLKKPQLRTQLCRWEKTQHLLLPPPGSNGTKASEFCPADNPQAQSTPLNPPSLRECTILLTPSESLLDRLPQVKDWGTYMQTRAHGQHRLFGVES